MADWGGSGYFREDPAEGGWADGGGSGEFYGGLAFGCAGDYADLIGAGLANCRSDLAKAVHYFFFDLLDHADVAKVNFADIYGAGLITPLL